LNSFDLRSSQEFENFQCKLFYRHILTKLFSVNNEAVDDAKLKHLYEHYFPPLLDSVRETKSISQMVLESIEKFTENSCIVDLVSLLHVSFGYN